MKIRERIGEINGEESSQITAESDSRLGRVLGFASEIEPSTDV
jgi:hypothetical protein